MKSKPIVVAVGVIILGAGAVAAYLFLPRGGSEPLPLAPSLRLPMLLEGRPALPLEVEVDREEILRIFPRRATTVEPPLPPKADVHQRQQSDQDILEKVTSRWVYVGHLNLTGVPVGTFRYNDKPNADEQFQLRQGELHEGVTVYYLDSSKAMARYGSATIRLPLIGAREVPASERPQVALTSESVADATQAWLFYWEMFGKKHRELSKDYVPAPGEPFPPKQPQTKAEIKERIDGYLEFVQQQLQERKPHPSYEQSGFSLDDMRKRLYENFEIEMEPESSPEESVESSEEGIQIGDQPVEQP